MTTASLKPLSGSPREVEAMVRDWLAEDGAGALAVRTSGSMGEPKDVLLSAQALRSSAQAALHRMGGIGAWTLALPAHYVAGLQVIVRSVLGGSSPVVLAEHSSLSAATVALPSGRRYLSAVPTQLHRWLQSAADTAALRSYDSVLIGGAAADEDLLRAGREADIPLVTTYGMSETCGGCVYDGIPLDGVAVALNGAGEIRIAGPMLFDGYLDRPELTAATLRAGWLHTQDLGCLDAEGRLDVLGRLDDTVVSGGVNVALPAVEQRIRAMSGVADCTVLGIPDVEWGARVVAFVAGPRDEIPDLAAVRTAIAASHPRTWAPREVVIVERIPMLATGKVDRQALIRVASSRV